jgi:purine-binding chemotaxis protein CheW
VSAPPATTAVVVRLGAAEYAIPGDRVREVLRAPHITRVPFAPRPLCGVAALRGELLSVFDLGAALGGAGAAPEGRMVVVEDPADGSRVGLLVDGVAMLLEGPFDAPEPLPEGAAARAPPGSLAGMIPRGQDTPVTLLNLEPVLAAGRTAGKERR